MARNDVSVMMENVQLIFRNFAGAATQFTPAGDRKFSIRLNQEDFEQLEADGWPVKFRQPKNEDYGDEPLYHLPVSLKYRNRKGEPIRPPVVVMITSRGRTRLDEEDLILLDNAAIETVDLMIRQVPWEVNGKTGIKAYLQSIYVTIHEDELERKYSDLDEVSAPPVRNYER